MTRIDPLQVEDAKGMDEIFALVRQSMGFVPNSMLTMAHRPALLQGFMAMARAVQGQTGIDPVLGQMVAHVASTASGCRYCQAHTAAVAQRRGADQDKLRAVWDFETDDRFTAAERSALRLARDAALVPNATTAAHFESLREHFDEGQIVDLVAIISMFGFLNRWNDTFATTLEQEPREFAQENLSPRGWTPGKHA